MSKIVKRLKSIHLGRGKASSSETDQSEKKKYVGSYDNSPVPILTLHSFIMGVFVSMGGFVFGYDTGQISGFLGMQEFQERFGQKNASGDGGYHFSNVRSGLIVALLSIGTLMGALVSLSSRK